MRTSECGYAASKRPPSRSTPADLSELTDDDCWSAAFETFRTRNPRRRERIALYQQLLDRGEHRSVAEQVLACRYRPAPPTEAWINKLDGRRKRIFRCAPLDELLFRVVNQLIQPVVADEMSPWCRSFLPGGGARAAFRTVLTDRTVSHKAALRLDVRDYFNSIDVDDLLARLPDALSSEPLTALLGASLRDRRIVRQGVIVDGGTKGVMAGTPIAPVLASLYLDDLDREVACRGVTYTRYSDDIIALAPPSAIADVEDLLRTRLRERGLEVNESKSAQVPPGDPWDFLGFRYHAGTIDLAPVTETKFRAKTTRLARRLLRWRERKGVNQEQTLSTFIRRINLRQYGVPDERANFSWATWFLPMLTTDRTLSRLDAHVQREARFATTGRRTASTRSAVPYLALTEAGYLPLVSAYWARRDGVDTYDRVVGVRTGLGAFDID